MQKMDIHKHMKSNMPSKNQKDGNNNPICKTEKETQMYRTDFWTLQEKAEGGMI